MKMHVVLLTLALLAAASYAATGSVGFLIASGLWSIAAVLRGVLMDLERREDGAE